MSVARLIKNNRPYREKTSGFHSGVFLPIFYLIHSNRSDCRAGITFGIDTQVRHAEKGDKHPALKNQFPRFSDKVMTEAVVCFLGHELEARFLVICRASLSTLLVHSILYLECPEDFLPKEVHCVRNPSHKPHKHTGWERFSLLPDHVTKEFQPVDKRMTGPARSCGERTPGTSGSLAPRR